jgi:hypothetical protein
LLLDTSKDPKVGPSGYQPQRSWGCWLEETFAKTASPPEQKPQKSKRSS